MPYKYETKNCKHCEYCVKTDKGLYCSHYADYRELLGNKLPELLASTTTAKYLLPKRRQRTLVLHNLHKRIGFGLFHPYHSCFLGFYDAKDFLHQPHIHLSRYHLIHKIIADFHLGNKLPRIPVCRIKSPTEEAYAGGGKEDG